MRTLTRLLALPAALAVALAVGCGGQEDDKSPAAGGQTDTAGSADAAETIACLPDPATPDKDPGCTAAGDAAFVAKLKSDAALDSDFRQIVKKCTLSPCQSKPCELDKKLCIRDCILKDTGKALSENCAWCYAAFSGYCGFKFCLSDCAADPGSDACKACLAANCDDKKNACLEGK
jgi:hypothetical protein